MPAESENMLNTQIQYRMVEELMLANEMLTKEIAEKEEKEVALREAKEKAEKANTAKTEFLSNMSHELRTPMNAVIGLTNLMLQEKPSEKQEEHLKTLKFSADNLLLLINDILDFNKIEDGKLTFEKIEFSLNNLLNNIDKSFIGRAEEKGIQLKFICDGRIPEKVKGDPLRITQILNNLISNAIKFTNNGGVMVKLSIIPGKSKRKRNIKFEVEDTGIGIPDDKLEDIFSAFTQANTSTTRKYGGSGLGLAITKRLVNIMGSDIEVTSTVGKGSIFSFEHTFEVLQKTEVKDIKINITKNNGNSLDGFKILLAEDNLINQKVASLFLQKWKVEIDIANNGLEAVELLKANNYGLVLMDLQMPKMDGFQATMEVRKMNNRKADIPIIALTASAISGENKKAIACGMNAFITKPFDPDELFNAIGKFYKTVA